jgi:hypothetical protein
VIPIPGFDIRYTTLEDLNYLQEWFKDPASCDDYPFNFTEKQDSLKNWVGFSKFKAAFDERLLEALENEGVVVRKRIVADLNERYPGKGYEPFDGRWRTHSLRKTVVHVSSSLRFGLLAFSAPSD